MHIDEYWEWVDALRAAEFTELKFRKSDTIPGRYSVTFQGTQAGWVSRLPAPTRHPWRQSTKVTWDARRVGGHLGTQTKNLGCYSTRQEAAREIHLNWLGR